MAEGAEGAEGAGRSGHGPGPAPTIAPGAGRDRHRRDAPTLVLASASPRRRSLLARLGVDPVVRAAEVDETPAAHESPDQLVLRLARAKADAVTAGDGEIVLAADTEVALDGRTLGKPQDAHDAASMLRRLAGRDHEVVTGLAVRCGEQRASTTVTTRVHVRELTDAEVAWYVATGEPEGKAGGYAIQAAGAVLVDRIEGSDTNVIGLPLPATVALLRQVGLDLLHPRGS